LLLGCRFGSPCLPGAVGGWVGWVLIPGGGGAEGMMMAAIARPVWKMELRDGIQQLFFPKGLFALGNRLLLAIHIVLKPRAYQPPQTHTSFARFLPIENENETYLLCSARLCLVIFPLCVYSLGDKPNASYHEYHL